MDVAGAPADVLACFESVPAILWAFEGPDLRVVAANAGARASGGNRPDMVGRPIREVLPELEGQQIFEMMEEAYAAGEVRAAEDRRVLVDRDGDGRLEEGFFTYTFLPTRRPDGSVRGLVVHIVETTTAARRRAAAEEEAAASEQRARRACDIVLELQRSLLPPGVPVLADVELAAHYRVAGDELAAGGDWFDALPLPDGRLVLVVGDVVGHGAVAAGAMGQLRGVLLDGLADGDPAAALERLDRFAARQAATRAATVCIAVLDPADGALRIASHAHVPPLLVGPDAAQVLDVATGAPLGTGGGPAPWAHGRLGPDEGVLLFSDGLVERAGRTLPATLAALAATTTAALRDPVELGTSLPEHPAERLVTVLAERMAFLGEGYGDDVTLLLARRREPARPLRCSLPAVPEALSGAREALSAWLDGLGAGRDDIEALLHASGEAVANAVQHAHGGRAPDARVELRGRLAAGGVVEIEVADGGRWRPPAPGPSRGGRGVLMMRELVDTAEIRPAPDGTTVRLAHALTRPVALGAGPPPSLPRPAELVVDLTEDPDAGHATVRVSGPVDLTTVGRLRAAVLHAVRGGERPASVDLTGVTVLSSAAVQMLHEVLALAPDLELVAPRGRPAAAVLALSGLDGRLRR